jgi:hypothetical protein|tara:strand:+ start:397 stop:777 length:381 start_codon:yes stop_codon:yes gene_type:complete
VSSSNPFEYVNSINFKKANLMIDEQSEDAYNAFIVNRAFSYFPDTVMQANEVNRRPDMDNKMKYDYLFYGIRPRKRFSKWHKNKEDETLSLIMQYYKYNRTKALECMKILTIEQIAELKKKFYKGE